MPFTPWLQRARWKRTAIVPAWMHGSKRTLSTGSVGVDLQRQTIQIDNVQSFADQMGRARTKSCGVEVSHESAKVRAARQAQGRLKPESGPERDTTDSGLLL